MKGIGVSSGMAFAKAYVIDDDIEIEKYSSEDYKYEINRLDNSLKIAKQQIEIIMKNALEHYGKENAEIFDFQLLLLEDIEFIGDIKEYLKNYKVNCEYAIDELAKSWIIKLSKIDNEYLRERTVDIFDVSKRLKFILMGKEIKDLSQINEKSIIVSKDLTPSQVVVMNGRFVKGIVIENGGKTSHTAIIARAMGIPCIVGIKNMKEHVKHGEMLLINGDTGEVEVSPSYENIEFMLKYEEAVKKEFEELNNYRDCKSITIDGHEVNILVNISTVNDLEIANKQNGDGVGLFRTEFIYMTRNNPPSEEQQYSIYEDIAKRLNGKPLIIRTLDVGGDKDISYLKIEKEDNPFLGFRAIRYCLENKEFFKTQLSAILRASLSKSEIKIMFPMISTMDELLRAKNILEETKIELRSKMIPFNEDIKVGMMVETPSAAFMAERFAREVDFFSIGTNDLTQYLFAADRLNSKVSYLNTYFHPLVISMVKHIKDCAANYGIEVDICGQAGEIPYLVPIWIAMGIDNLSVSPSVILKLRKLICNLNKNELMPILNHVLKLDTASEVERYLKDIFEGII